MKAQLATDAGVKTLQQMIAANKASMPGNNELDAVAAWAAWLQGKVAMLYLLAADRPHERELLAERQGHQLRAALHDRRQGRLRGGAGPATASMPSGYVKALAADSANPEAAYLFMQWVTSPPVSLVRAMLPYSLRDPYRLSHYKSPSSTARSGPARKEYLSTLCNSANVGVVD